MTEATQVNGNRLLEVNNLQKLFPITKGFLKRVVGQVRAVDGVSFYINEGETLALVGESGCGKTTTSRCILRALDPTSGEILYRTGAGEEVDIATLSNKPMRELRREIQMIFPDPFSSLNPRMTLLDVVGEPLLNFGMKSSSQREERVSELLRLVGLRPEYLRRFPHAFSGGQRQRIGIARALALNPRLIVADEPVSALDVSVQAQVLNLMADLQSQFGLAYLFVAHDLSVVKQFSDRVAVMYVGKIAEMAHGRAIRQPQAPVHRGPAVVSPEAGPACTFKADTAGRRGSESRRPPDGVLLPPSVCLRDGHLPDRDACSPGGLAGPLRELPPRRGAGARWGRSTGRTKHRLMHAASN